MTIPTTLLDEEPERALLKNAPEVEPVSSQTAAGHPDSVAELERLINAKRPIMLAGDRSAGRT